MPLQFCKNKESDLETRILVSRITYANDDNLGFELKSACAPAQGAIPQRPQHNSFRVNSAWRRTQKSEHSRIFLHTLNWHLFSDMIFKKFPINLTFGTIHA